MNTPFVVKLLKPFRKLFDRGGIPFDELDIVLTLKFTLTARKPSTMQINQQKRKDIENGKSAKPFLQHIFFSLMGLMLIPLVLFGNSVYFSVMIYAAIILFMFLSSMIADYSSVLLDTRDQAMFLTRPIHKETLSTARLIHIISYLSLMLVELTLPVTIAFFIRFGPTFGILLLLMNILLMLFTVTLTAAIYFLLLRFMDGERLKDVINMFQILLTVMLTLGYQIVPRIGSIAMLNDEVIQPKLWHLLLPPAWFAAVVDITASDYLTLILRFIGIGMPLLLIIVYVKWIAPNFEQYLNRLNSHGQKAKKRARLWTFIMDRCIGFLSSNDLERAYTRLSYRLLTRERSTKLRLYPQMAMALIFPFIFVLSGLLDGDLSLKGNGYFLMGFLISVLFISANSVQIRFSESPKGAWVYQMTSKNSQWLTFRASVKGYALACYLPIYLIIAPIFLWSLGLRGLIFLGINLSSALVTLAINASSLHKSVPFSEPYDVDSMKSGQLGRSMLNMLILTIFAGLHFLALKVTIPWQLFMVLILLSISYGIWKLVYYIVRQSHTNSNPVRAL